MNINILGTGMVGRAHAEKLVKLGHKVAIGSHDVAALLAKTEKDAMGTPPFSEWHALHPDIAVVTTAEACLQGEIILEALKGEVAVAVLKAVETELAGKILIDIANPLDFSQGMPPSLSICNTDSLGEQIQKALPQTKVVKTFNTMSAPLQVDPQQLDNGDHHIFLSGNDAAAKTQVQELLTTYGWKNILDLGDITTARGTEMLLPIWLRLWGALQTPMFNFKLVVQKQT